MKTQTKNLKTSLWMLTLLMTLTFFSCEKDPLEDCRKDPTCEYFTCKVNGVRWEPQCKGEPFFGGCTPWDVQYYRKTSGNIEMHIKNKNAGQNFAFLTRNEKLRIGDNKLHVDEFYGTFFSDGSDNGCNIFVLDTISPYSFHILKIDTIKYYLMGTFDFKGNNDCGDQVTITDGEFNLPYRF
ncbi:MAG: hypothetical protein IPN79_14330 [Saprospiraceae bacterium]|nr:hypothetical protein [Saprospiraceae bacterium]